MFFILYYNNTDILNYSNIWEGKLNILVKCLDPRLQQTNIIT